MRIGITGGPGSGKTTFSYYLTQLLPNCYSPDVDMIYHNRGQEKMMDTIGWRYVTAGTKEEEANKSYEYILKLCEERKIEINGDFSLKEKASYALSKLSFKYTKEYLDKEVPKNCDFVVLDFYLLPYLKEFCDLDYSVLLDVDASIRYDHALTRMSKNEGKSFSKEEKESRIKKMEEFEKKENVNYQIIKYDSILKNPSSLESLQNQAKRLALQILKKYSISQINDMLRREYDSYVNNVIEYSDSFSYKRYAYKELKESFGNSLISKLLFLYENNLMDEEMFALYLEKRIYAIKYYLDKNKASLYFEDKVKEFSQELKENITDLYEKDLIDKDFYNKLMKETKRFKKTAR